MTTSPCTVVERRLLYRIPPLELSVRCGYTTYRDERQSGKEGAGEGLSDGPEEHA
jgi:hypothetical protein